MNKKDRTLPPERAALLSKPENYAKLQAMAFTAAGFDSILDFQLTLFRMSKDQLIEFHHQVHKMVRVLDEHLEKRGNEDNGYVRTQEDIDAAKAFIHHKRNPPTLE